MISIAEPSAPGTRSAGREAPGGRRPGYVPLLHKIVGINALLVIVAVVVTIAVLAPSKVSAIAFDEELAVLVIAVALVVVSNLYLLRRIVGPLQSLTAFARQVDYANLGQRVPDARPVSEAGELALTFNQMLARLHDERREATGRVLRAQEAERLRIAQELHDQVGQELTAVLLGLSRVTAHSSGPVRDDALAVQEAVRRCLEDVRRIAVELRPEALDDLGLASALAVLADRFSEQLGLDVRARIATDGPAVPAEVELVVYRIAQEALTNIARHSASSRADLTLAHRDGRLMLGVADYGLGLPPDYSAGTGMRGMRERAALIGATLEIRNRRSGPGCEVCLEVPLEAAL